MKIVDGGLAGVIFLAPLLMGGRHPLGQLALVSLAALTSIAWAMHQWRSNSPSWRPARASLLLLVGAAFVLLQTAPLPVAVLQRIAPQVTDILPLWSAADPSSAGLGAWRCVSFTPAETLSGLTLFVAYGLLFVVVVQRANHIEDVERLLRWCGLAAAGMAVLGLAQLFTSNGKFLWFYQHPLSTTLDTAKGSFSNHNHFASFLAMGIGPLTWWLLDAARRAGSRRRGVAAASPDVRRNELRMYLAGVALGVVVFANLLSLSRGGILAALIAALVCITVSYYASAVGGKVLATLGACVLLIGVALAVFGYDRVADRLDELSSGSMEQLDQNRGRRAIWSIAMKAIPHHAMVGAGVGGFREVYPMYDVVDSNSGTEYTHAENSPLQIALETGVVGLVLVLAGAACCALWCLRGCCTAASDRLRLCAGAVAASLAAAAVHGFVDFVWYVPACASFIAIFAACALRLCQLADPCPSAAPLTLLPRWAPTAALLALAPLGCWMAAVCTGPALAAPHWDQYLIDLDADEAEQRLAEQSGTTPADTEDPDREQRKMDCVETVVHWQPSHYRAQLALAEMQMRRFERLQRSGENPMSLIHVRDAVVQSRFPTREAMVRWLSLAVGSHWVDLERSLDHARQSLALCPLQGRGYVRMAKVAFVGGGGVPCERACIEQALKVRPFDGDVLYAAASESFLAGDPSRWLEYAKQAFHSGRTYQRRLISDLIGHSATEGVPTMIAFLLDEFHPDLEGMRLLHSLCAKRCRPELVVPLCRAWAEKAKQEAMTARPAQAASLWLEAMRLFQQLEEPAYALECAQNAVKSDPSGLSSHQGLASCLMRQGSFADAESQLRWCLQRSPDDQITQEQFKLALRGRLEAERQAAVGAEKRR